jgi:hypothetical protein
MNSGAHKILKARVLVVSVKVILTTNRQDEHHEASEIVFRERRLLFRNTWSDRRLKTSARVEKLTVEMVLPEDDARLAPKRVAVLVKELYER